MGPEVGGLITWQAITQGPLPAEVFADNGPAPSSLPSAVWGVEKEVVRIDRLLNAFFLGESNFVDWYYPSAGPSTTSGLVSLDSTPLSVGRGRRDIENLTRAGSVDIPVLALGASNGLTPVAADYLPYAQSLAICAAPSCDGAPRVIDAGAPSEAFPTFGGAGGGFEVVISEGLSHLDMGVLEDDRNNRIYGPLMRFIERNLQ
jgi:hypothetical protein